MPADDAAELLKFLEENFPQAPHRASTSSIVDDTTIRLRLPTHERHLRPGGTISGPT